MRRQNYYFTTLGFSALLIYVHTASTFYGFDLAFSAASSPIWKFFVSFIGHEDWNHLLTNISFIAIFGTILEKITNGKIFLAVFGISALFANLSAFMFFPEGFVIGASGGASGILAALAIVRPRVSNSKLGFSFPIWGLLSVYVIANFVGIGSSTGIAYELHLLGVLAGITTGLCLKYRERCRN